jgi:hypothetical protein
VREGAGGVREGWGKGGEMTQTLYAHMNKIKMNNNEEQRDDTQSQEKNPSCNLCNLKFPSSAKNSSFKQRRVSKLCPGAPQKEPLGWSLCPV